MAIDSKLLAETIRDNMHNYVINSTNEIDDTLYFSNILHFINLVEGSENEAYLDGIEDPKRPGKYITASKFYALSPEDQQKKIADCKAKNKEKTGKEKGPITTVGIGANIESKKTRERLDQLLNEVDLMEKVYYGKAKLTDNQIEIIFKDDIRTRVSELHRIYGKENWNKLRVNERISILSLYFNYPRLVDHNTNCKKYITEYIETNNATYLKSAVTEVKEKSNRAGHKGIQNRRNAEAVLLASYYVPTYTKPCESPDSVKVKLAEIDKTIIPRNSDTAIMGINKEYFVWRTMMDKKVRVDHIKREGKIFKKNGEIPQDIINCRCWVEEVPDYVVIKDEEEEQKAFEVYLRTGEINPILRINNGFVIIP